MYFFAILSVFFPPFPRFHEEMANFCECLFTTGWKKYIIVILFFCASLYLSQFSILIEFDFIKF